MKSPLIVIRVYCVFVLNWQSVIAQEVPVELPPGFSISKVAGDDLVPDASAMIVDPSGSPIVSGPGYVRRLIDDDGDRVYEKFETLATTKGIAQGIWFDGKQMWLTVDGAVKRSVSREQGQPFKFEDVVSITTNAEHGSHVVRKGPDGWWYVLCGNATQIRESYFALPTSPIKDPRAGFLMRFPADVGTGNKFAAEIVCHGFRNAYDFDFDSRGQIFVYDSDGERDVSLPWYRPTRVFRIQPGDDAGWVSASWKRPSTFFDMPTEVGEFGRGSPTGVVCKSKKFGGRNTDAVFVGDWTFGRIGIVRPGGSAEIFAKPRGNFGFAVTDLDFDNKGSLFVTTGGRGTEGSLYRIWKAEDAKDAELSVDEGGINAADQIDKTRREFVLRMSERFGQPQDILKDNGTAFANAIQQVAASESNVWEVRWFQLILGGCDGRGMFAGHRAKRPREFSDADQNSISESLRTLLEQDEVRFEVARLAGMLQMRNDAVANQVADAAIKEADPVKRIHYLNCFAVEGGRLDDDMVEPVAAALLRVRREIDAAELPVDRNWKPRMLQLARSLFGDMRIAEAIVKDVSFGNPGDVWMYDALPEIFRQLARAKIAVKMQADPNGGTRQQLVCLAGDPSHVDLMRSLSMRAEFTDVIVQAIHSQPLPRDKAVLLRGLDSFNLTVNKAALIGLQKLDVQKPVYEDLVALMGLEGRLGWTNPEISVRDQLVKLLRKWTGESVDFQLRQYDLDADQVRQQRSKIDQWKAILAKDYSVELKTAVSTQELLDRYAKIDFELGDQARGKLAYQKFQCASCHDGGGQNSGPSLAGIASRFSRDDVLRAIVDPNDNVPDRYRAVIVATEDGQLFKGSVVYESKAGIMLATSTGEVIRVAADNIESRRKSNKSLMPEGLLQQASDQDVSDLWAYLNKLK